MSSYLCGHARSCFPMLPQRLPPGHSVQSPRGAATFPHRLPLRSIPPAALRLRAPPIHEDMVVHGLCGRVTDSARNACSLNCCCLAVGASIGCWMRLLPAKGAGVGWQMLLLVVRGTVPANHRARFQNANTS